MQTITHNTVTYAEDTGDYLIHFSKLICCIITHFYFKSVIHNNVLHLIAQHMTRSVLSHSILSWQIYFDSYFGDWKGHIFHKVTGTHICKLNKCLKQSRQSPGSTIKRHFKAMFTSIPQFTSYVTNVM